MHRDAQRRLIYLVVLAALAPLTLAVWAARQDVDVFVRFTYPCLAGYLAWTAVQLWLRPDRIRELERRSFLVIAILALGGGTARLYTIGDLDEAWQAMAVFSGPVLLLCVVLAQLVFDTRRALRVGVGLLLASLGLGLIRILPQVGSDGANSIFVSFLWYHAVQGVTLFFLYIVARIKDDLRSAEFEAERMRAMAHEDALTGLANRRELQLELERQQELSERSGRPFAVILCDVDRFKDLNDAHGHAFGDAVLAELGALLRTAVRTGDVAGRWGGEEFLIIAPAADLTVGVALAERLRERIAAHAFGGTVHVTASLGVAAWQASASTTRLLREADAYLYAAKDAGRDAVRAAPRRAERTVADAGGPAPPAGDPARG